MIEIQRNFNISKKIKFNSKVLREKISSENIVTNELLRFGGIKSIRGFDENSIFTNEYTLLNTNLNFYINDTIYIYTLFDLANYRNNIFELNENIYAGGFGFSTTTQNGIISVNYAKGNEWGKKFSLKNAKLSVSFISYF
jgi:hemolysin activation/secretion protein